MGKVDHQTKEIKKNIFNYLISIFWTCVTVFKKTFRIYPSSFNAFVLTAILSATPFAHSNLLLPTPKTIPELCSQLKSSVTSMKWKIEPCNGVDWKSLGNSVNGTPLIYAEFGNINAPNTTLVLTMIHGDEITPLYLGIQIAHWIRENLSTLGNTHIVIAPLVNPDGFLSQPRTRVNARGVDVNRNFKTKDWDARALKLWQTNFHKNPRRFPGYTSNSEPETMFQVELLEKFKPNKILSVHAPLNFMDYDGPTTLSLARFSREYVRECLKLRTSLKAVSGGFYPGSLGNRAGRELGIPTLTLELPTADPRKAKMYWDKFKPGIRTMIEFSVPEVSSNP